MPNIYIKTRMRKMPECCAKCRNYIPSMHQDAFEFMDEPEYNEPPKCYQTSVLKALSGVIVTKERPAWCPLVEMEGSKTE
jgi:hypothetical protein